MTEKEIKKAPAAPKRSKPMFQMNRAELTRHRLAIAKKTSTGTGDDKPAIQAPPPEVDQEKKSK